MQLKLSTRYSTRLQQDPATICSAVNHRLQIISPRLASSLTVNAIISAIRKRQVIHRLYLVASFLGDAACVRSFTFLTSPVGLHCRQGLTELFLTRNEIGAQGLLAVAAFLRDNTVLRELCLSGNPLTSDSDVISDFANALNSSRLCTLQLLHCSSLGDSFAQAFLPQLTTPYLRELGLSAINMTRASVPILADYLGSTRCRLERLHCFANRLTLSGARTIVHAIEKNSSLLNVRLDDLHIEDHAVAAEDRTTGWQGCNRALNTVLQRNSVHMARVKEESLALLRCSRALFLRSGMGGVMHGVHALASLSRRSRNSQSFDAPSPFFDLPAELQQEIISYLAPSLSHQQRMRVVYFAADVTTLFRFDRQSDGIRGRTKQREVFVKTNLGRRSSSRKGQPFEGTWRPPTWWECHCSTDLRPSCRCLRKWKREMRDLWLTQVACNAYEHVL